MQVTYQILLHCTTVETKYTVQVSVCAPINANAGLGPAVTVKAHLEGYPRVANSVTLSTNVEHVYGLQFDEEIKTDYMVNPGIQKVNREILDAFYEHYIPWLTKSSQDTKNKFLSLVK